MQQWMHELRFESVQRSLQAYRRAKRMRMVFILGCVLVGVVRLGVPQAMAQMVSAPFLVGMIFFLSFLTFTAESATCRQYAESL
jgi:hypothetical protein